MRWRGNYSEKDTMHWTPALKKALNFDPNAAAMIDNGIHWQLMYMERFVRQI